MEKDVQVAVAINQGFPSVNSRSNESRMCCKRSITTSAYECTAKNNIKVAYDYENCTGEAWHACFKTFRYRGRETREREREIYKCEEGKMKGVYVCMYIHIICVVKKDANVALT